MSNRCTISIHLAIVMDFVLKLKILLLSGYDAASHLYWRELLQQQLSQFDWTQLALPARHFSWRTRGSSLSFAFQHPHVLDQSFDRLVVTSMVDLASLRGFCPQLAIVPTLLYFHENQFVYPVSNQQPNIVNAQLTSIYSALCADKIAFNSHYNQQTFFAGARALLNRLPDGVPARLLDSAESKSIVMPVPIELCKLPRQGTGNLKQSLNYSEFDIVWNHRWEYDKQPQVFFDAVRKLIKAGYAPRLHVLGQSFRQTPDCFAEAKVEFADYIIHWGFQPQAQYEMILDQADMVISSALHDFQGLSMLQAINRGCFPIAPKRVAYPEYLNERHLYSVGASTEIEAQNLFEKILKTLNQREFLLPDISGYLSNNLLSQYVDEFQALSR